MKTITIFTPTYNRAYILPKLYESLCRQSNNDFVWMIVDDGSTDDTEQLVQSWIDDGNIEIRYYKQTNLGKMRAHNLGAKLCDTPLFGCVDSDDYLTINAVELILSFWKSNFKGEEGICGMITNRLMVNKENKTPHLLSKFPNVRCCRIMDLTRKFGQKGETFIVFRTSVLVQYPFPEIDNEKFITEAVVSDQLDQRYQILICHEAVVVCEYLEDGYTFNGFKYYKIAPKGWALFYNQQLLFYRDEYSFKQKIKCLVYYIIMSKLAKITELKIYKNSHDKSYRYFLAKLLAPFYAKKHSHIFS